MQSRCVAVSPLVSKQDAYAHTYSQTQALHENFPLLRYTDPTLAKTAQAAEWLAFSDLVQGRQMEAQVHICVYTCIRVPVCLCMCGQMEAQICASPLTCVVCLFLLDRQVT